MKYIIKNIKEKETEFSYFNENFEYENYMSFIFDTKKEKAKIFNNKEDVLKTIECLNYISDKNNKRNLKEIEVEIKYYIVKNEKEIENKYVNKNSNKDNIKFCNKNDINNVLVFDNEKDVEDKLKEYKEKYLNLEIEKEVIEKI